MKRVNLFTSIFIIVSLLLMVVPAQAEVPGSFYMVKACTGPGICSITQADGPFSVFEGQSVSYTNYHFGPDASGNMHMTAAITLTASNPEDTVSGIVSWVYHNGVFTGHISLQSGTGAFAGVHAEGEIGVLSWPSTFYFSGNYFFTP